MSDSPGDHRMICPFCEMKELTHPYGARTVRCESCGSAVGSDVLEALRQIVSLPDVIGRHACECGHPEMRRLPDAVFWCPACGSEVLPTKPSRPA